jgi:hypothetical protein
MVCISVGVPEMYWAMAYVVHISELELFSTMNILVSGFPMHTRQEYLAYREVSNL